MWDTHIIAEIIGCAVAVGSGVLIAQKARGVNETRLSALETESRRDDDTMTEIKQELQQLNIKLERFITALIGVDGQNGLRGELRALEAKVDELAGK